MTTIVSFADDSMVELRGTYWKAQQEYCRVNGYRWVGFIEPLVHDRPASWNKILILLRMMKTDGVVWWLDADIFPVDYSVRLPDVQLDIHIAYDDHGYNAGIIGLKESDEIRRFLHEVWEQEDCIFAHTWEQLAIKRLLPISDLTVSVLPKRFNAHPIEIEQGVIRNPVFVHYYAVNNRERMRYFQGRANDL